MAVDPEMTNARKMRNFGAARHLNPVPCSSPGPLGCELPSRKIR